MPTIYVQNSPYNYKVVIAFIHEPIDNNLLAIWLENVRSTFRWFIISYITVVSVQAISINHRRSPLVLGDLEIAVEVI